MLHHTTCSHNPCAQAEQKKKKNDDKNISLFFKLSIFFECMFLDHLFIIFSFSSKRERTELIQMHYNCHFKMKQLTELKECFCVLSIFWLCVNSSKSVNSLLGAIKWLNKYHNYEFFQIYLKCKGNTFNYWLSFWFCCFLGSVCLACSKSSNGSSYTWDKLCHGPRLWI